MIKGSNWSHRSCIALIAVAFVCSCIASSWPVFGLVVRQRSRCRTFVEFVAAPSRRISATRLDCFVAQPCFTIFYKKLQVFLYVRTMDCLILRVRLVAASCGSFSERRGNSKTQRRFFVRPAARQLWNVGSNVGCCNPQDPHHLASTPARGLIKLLVLSPLALSKEGEQSICDEYMQDSHNIN